MSAVIAIFFATDCPSRSRRGEGAHLQHVFVNLRTYLFQIEVEALALTADTATSKLDQTATLQMATHWQQMVRPDFNFQAAK